MKHSLTLLIFGLLSMPTIAQTDTTVKSYVAPEFKGGLKAFHSYLGNYLRYPQELWRNGKQGNVTATIYLDQTGNIKDVIASGKNEVLNNEVKRVLILMPHWESGKLNGVPIDTTVTKEVYFSIEDSRIKKDSTKYECLMYSVKVNLLDRDEATKRKESADKYAAAKAIYDKGVSELQNNNAADALDIFNQADQQGFHNIDLYYNRGVANLKTGNKEAACQDWLEGARLGDDEALELYNKKCK